MPKYFVAVILFSAINIVEAQVRVIDSTPQSVRSGVSRQQETVDQKTEMYNQIQSLQQEISELRAQIEEQGHQISRLKQLQLDNYVDLDRRVAFLTNNAPTKTKSADEIADTASVSQHSSVAVNDDAIDPAVIADGPSEADDYKAAYDLLRQRQVDQSLAAFKTYLQKYPEGDFASNSCYWLGEIYLLKNQLPQARDWFSKLLQGFPQSNKVPDAKFKLGKVYHLLGDKKRAKSLLDEAASGSGDSARMAKQYIKENF